MAKCGGHSIDTPHMDTLCFFFHHRNMIQFPIRSSILRIHLSAATFIVYHHSEPTKAHSDDHKSNLPDAKLINKKQTQYLSTKSE